MPKYRSINEYEEWIRQSHQQKYGRPIESDVQAYLTMQNALSSLAMALDMARQTEQIHYFKDVVTERPSIACYPSGEIEFLLGESASLSGGFLGDKRDRRVSRDDRPDIPYIEMTWEERVRSKAMEPISVDEALDMVKFLQDYEGDLSELLPPRGPKIERGDGQKS